MSMRTTGMATISSFLEPDSVAVARTANARGARRELCGTIGAAKKEGEVSAPPRGEMTDELFPVRLGFGKYSAPGRDGSRAGPSVRDATRVRIDRARRTRRGYVPTRPSRSPNLGSVDPSIPGARLRSSKPASSLQRRPLQKPRVGGRKIGAEPRGILAGDGEGLQGSKAPSIGITCPAFTPCDANVDRGAHLGSRMRGARLGAAREKGTCILSPRRISERGGWGLVETETHRRARHQRGSGRREGCDGRHREDAVRLSPVGHRAWDASSAGKLWRLGGTFP